MSVLSALSRFARASGRGRGDEGDGATGVGGRMLSGVISAGGESAKRGTKDFLAGYSSMPWLRAVTSRVSYDIAATEWFVMVPRHGGKAVRDRAMQRSHGASRATRVKARKAAGELDTLDTHPLIDLLDDFNPFQTGLMGRRVTQLHMDLVGEAFWLLERGALNQPVAIWPLPPHWVVRTPSPGHASFEVRFGSWHEVIPASEMIWFSDVDPLNPYGRGTGTSQALADELETDEYTAKHIKAFYFNRARPDLLIWPKGDQPLRPEEVDRLEENWTTRHAGFWRAFRPFFMRREVEVKELEQSFQNQQLIQLREFERNTILHTFGVSPETLGIVGTGSNRATITMGDSIYSRRVLVPRLELIRTVLQERLLPEFDERLVLDYVSPVVRDKELELEAAKAAPWAMTTNEWREMQGLDPLLNDADGGAHMGPLTIGPIAFEPAAPLVFDFGAGVNDGVIEEADADGDIFTAAGDAEAGAAHAKALFSHDDDPPATKLADSQVIAYRRAQEAAWRRFAEGGDLAAVAEAVEANDPDAVVAAFGGEQALARAFASPLLDKGRIAFLRGVELAMSGLPHQRAPIGVSLQDFNPAAVAWARKEAAQLVVGASEQVQKAIAQIIARAHAQGITPRDTATLISKRIVLLARQEDAVEALGERLTREALEAAPASATRLTTAHEARIARRVDRYKKALLRQRAMLIARTELIASTNAGQQTLWQTAVKAGALPANIQRVWLVTLDDALDQKICEPLTDVRAGMDEPFEPGGYMQPPAHPGCRCSLGLATFAKPTAALRGATEKA